MQLKFNEIQSDWISLKTSTYYSYDDAKKKVHQLHLYSRHLYSTHYQSDLLLPPNPSHTYKNNGWENWKSFLPPQKCLSFAEARKAIQNIGCRNTQEFLEKYSQVPNMPSDPSTVYKGKGWKSWKDFLNADHSEYYPSYMNARKSVKKLRIKSQEEYLKNHTKDKRLPPNPEIVYMNTGWKDWFHFVRV